MGRHCLFGFFDILDIVHGAFALIDRSHCVVVDEDGWMEMVGCRSLVKRVGCCSNLYMQWYGGSITMYLDASPGLSGGVGNHSVS
jgi:hypothetical protein